MSFQQIEDAIKEEGGDPYDEALYQEVLDELRGRGVRAVHAVAHLEANDEAERAINREARDSLYSVRARRRGTRQLLTAPEERHLIEIYQRGRQLSGGLDSAAEYARDAVNLGQRALDTLITSNYRLVYKLALRLLPLCKSLDLDDLVQEGLLGLLRALRGFDLERRERLSTYATWHVQQAMRRAMENQDAIIRLPAHMCELVLRWRKACRRLQGTLGREPSQCEVAELLQVEPGQIALAEQYGRYRVQALETPVGDGESSLSDLLPGEAPTPEDLALAEDARWQRAQLPEALRKHLGKRDAEVLLMRAGLSPDTEGEPMTLAEVGDVYGLTRERIRQIEARGLIQLRSWLQRSGLKKEDFYA